MNPADRTVPGCDIYTEEDLRGFAEGFLPEAQRLALAEHLPDCPACEAAVGRLMLETPVGGLVAVAIPAADQPAFVAFRSRLQPPSAPEAQIEIGGRVGHLEVVRKLGQGGSSNVYKCLDQRMGRHVAVKFLNPRLFDDSHLARLEREARALAMLDHPWIVKAFEIQPFHFPPYIVMELAPGGPSSRLIDRGPLPPRVAARLVAGVARALEHAHGQNIIHRDIKPSNLLMSKELDFSHPVPDELTLKISDFGLARPLGGDSQLTSTGNILGTPAYMAPEQAGGKQERVDPASDIFSLGVVLYEFLIGRPPLLADNAVQTLRLITEVEPIPPRMVQPGIPRDLDTICMKCMRKEPGERYATAGDLACDLERFLAGRPIVARPISPAGQVFRLCKRNPALAAAIGSIILLLATLVGMAVNFTITQNELLRQAEESAVRSRQAEIEAGLEADSSRNIMFNGVRNLTRVTDELGRLPENKDAMLVALKAKEMNRQTIDSYLKYRIFQKEIVGDRIDLCFRDALSLLDLGFVDQSIVLLEKLIATATRSRPGQPDHARLVSAGNRSVSVLAKMKLKEQKGDEAQAILMAGFKLFKLENLKPFPTEMQMIERRVLLETLQNVLKHQTPNEIAEQINAELQLIQKQILQASVLQKK